MLPNGAKQRINSQTLSQKLSCRGNRVWERETEVGVLWGRQAQNGWVDAKIRRLVNYTRLRLIAWSNQSVAFWILFRYVDPRNYLSVFHGGIYVAHRGKVRGVHNYLASVSSLPALHGLVSIDDISAVIGRLFSGLGQVRLGRVWLIYAIMV